MEVLGCGSERMDLPRNTCVGGMLLSKVFVNL